MNGITFDYYIGKCQFVYKAEDTTGNARPKFFFGDTEDELEQAIRQYGGELEKYRYFYEDKKYYNDLFELLGEQQ